MHSLKRVKQEMNGAFFPGSNVLAQIVLRTGVIYLLVLIGVR